MFSQILVPLDGSTIAEQALPVAGALSRGLKIPIKLFSVIDSGGLLTATDQVRYFDELVENLARASKAYLQGTAAKMTGLTVDWMVEQGSVAEKVVHYCGVPVLLLRSVV